MTGVPVLWRVQRPVGRAYGVRRAVAVFVVARTTFSRTAVITWALTGGGLAVLVVVVGWGERMVAPAHNATLSWSTGISLSLLAVLGLISSALDRPSRDVRFRRGVQARAVLNARVYACRAGDERAVGLSAAEIGKVRWICGVASVQSTKTRKWHLYPAELFPSRAEWGALKQSAAATRPRDTASPPDARSEGMTGIEPA